MFFYVLVATLLEILVFYTALQDINNRILSYICTLTEGVLLGLCYYSFMNFKFKNVFFLLFSVILVSTISLDLILNGLVKLNTLSRNAECTLLSFIALFYFYSLLKKPEIKNIFSSPLFWFNTGVLIYFSGNIFLFLFSNYLDEKNPDAYLAFNGIHSVLNITFSTLLALTFIKSKHVS